MYKILLVGLLIFTNSFYLSFSQSNSWSFVKDKKGVKVYYREVPHKSINEVKIITTFNTNLSTIVEGLLDVNAYEIWAYKVTSSKVVKVLHKNEMVYYNKIDFPWPLSNRDIAVHTKITQNLSTKEVNSISFAVPEAVPLLKDFVRMAEFNSKWAFIPKDGKVQAEYIFSANPGGNIPAWLINLSLDEGPIKAIQAFKKLLVLEKYTKHNSIAIIN